MQKVLPLITVAQNTEIYPISFLQFQHSNAFYNPAVTATNSKFELNLLNTNYTGLLKNVGLYYLDVSFKKKVEQKMQVFGLIVHSEYETELLKRSRALIRYAWKTPLNDEISFSGGASFGLYNYLVKGTTSSAGGSVLTIDGNAGMWLEGYHFKTGISINQIPNSSVSPINRAIVLKRYVTAIAEYNLSLSADNMLLFALKVNNNRQNQSNLQGTVAATILNNYSIGFIYLYQQGAGFTLGLKNFNLTNTTGDVGFSYLKNGLLMMSSTTKTLGKDRIEFFLRFYIDK